MSFASRTGQLAHIITHACHSEAGLAVTQAQGGSISSDRRAEKFPGTAAISDGVPSGAFVTGDGSERRAPFNLSS